MHTSGLAMDSDRLAFDCLNVVHFCPEPNSGSATLWSWHAQNFDSIRGSLLAGFDVQTLCLVFRRTVAGGRGIENQKLPDREPNAGPSMPW
jgi:hypothetical protein